MKKLVVAIAALTAATIASGSASALPLATTGVDASASSAIVKVGCYKRRVVTTTRCCTTTTTYVTVVNPCGCGCGCNGGGGGLFGVGFLFF
ncbi:hypothetical protein JDN40_13115 [Rhodomicrobium vannielii ATCC 17100]|uniref:hypothetical protein n=1 Tax=Rhodomicrobium vannielii TaxID=1069 RepID=UPI001918780E|nr:hypothetical protein [Rhodomicrobium vannielii]MBJ7535049.1 hypothetical protein [Rhodomicrobium vannielii ATCC 17100]